MKCLYYLLVSSPLNELEKIYMKRKNKLLANGNEIPENTTREYLYYFIYYK